VLLHGRQQEDRVVHRECEHPREEEHWRPGVDEALRVEPQYRLEVNRLINPQAKRTRSVAPGPPAACYLGDQYFLVGLSSVARACT
jgi:hypothetical protein